MLQKQNAKIFATYISIYNDLQARTPAAKRSRCAQHTGALTQKISVLRARHIDGDSKLIVGAFAKRSKAMLTPESGEEFKSVSNIFDSDLAL